MKSNNHIYQIFKSNEPAKMLAFVQSCPKGQGKDMALQSLQNFPEYGIMALNAISMQHCTIGDTALGYQSSNAQYQLCKEAIETNGLLLNKFNITFFVNAAWLLSGVLLRLNQFNDLKRLTDRARSDFKKMGLRHLLVPVELNLTQGHILTGDYDAAQNLYNKIKNKAVGAAYVSMVKDLGIQLEQRRSDSFSMEKSNANEQYDIEGDLQRMESMKAIFKNDPVKMKAVDDFIAEARAMDISKLVSQPEILAFRNKLLETQNILMGNDTSSVKEQSYDSMMMEINVLLSDPKQGYDAEILEDVYIKIKKEHGAERNFSLEEKNDLIWIMAVCQLRLKDYEKAFSWMSLLWDNIEKARSGIRNVAERAGILTTYRHLFDHLCTAAFILKKEMDLLLAMEASKGRVLADYLLPQGILEDRDDFYGIVKKLPQLLSRSGAHYLSYYVDEEAIYGLLLTNKGRLHSHRIEISQEKLRSLIGSENISQSNIHPHNWQKQASFFSASVDLSEALKPLLAWLEPLLESGEILEGDHIVYSPDDELHLIPLHYISFQGVPAVYYFSFSKVNGALHLFYILLKNKNRQQHYHLVQSHAAGEDTEKIRQLSATGKWLEKTLKGEALLNRQTNVFYFHKKDLSNKIVHFATHGTFPDKPNYKDIEEGNPYYRSGLLLAGKGKLPVLAGDYEPENSHLLSPARLMKFQTDFSGSHISLQACVSGLVKEGLGGDALGLDIAFFVLKASSLLSSHWNVDAKWSSNFCILFYHYWLKNGQSKAKAWRETVLYLLESEESENPYIWAAFSLMGDWR